MYISCHKCHSSIIVLSLTMNSSLVPNVVCSAPMSTYDIKYMKEVKPLTTLFPTPVCRIGGPYDPLRCHRGCGGISGEIQSLQNRFQGRLIGSQVIKLMPIQLEICKK